MNIFFPTDHGDNTNIILNVVKFVHCGEAMNFFFLLSKYDINYLNSSQVGRKLKDSEVGTEGEI